MRTFFALVLVIAVTTAPAWSADPSPLGQRAAAIERASTAPDGYRVVVGHLSRELSIPVDGLRAQRLQTGLDWGTIFIANRIAKEAGMSFEQVVAELRAGKQWEDIVRDHKVDLQKLTGSVAHTQSVVERRGEDKAPPPMEWKSVAPPGSSPTGMVPGLVPQQGASPGAGVPAR